MESPNDLRYETLIKIISSASVGCRGAYTTASRECNDLNGNNSVKDGCSRPCKYVAGASMPPLPAFRSARIGRKKGRGNTSGRRNGRAPVTSSFGLWIPTSDDDYNTGDKNVGCEDKNSRETREPERSKCALPLFEGWEGGGGPVAISPSLPREKNAKRCSPSRAKYGACCVSRDDTWQGTTEARTSFAFLDILIPVRSIRHNGTRHLPLLPTSSPPPEPSLGRTERKFARIALQERASVTVA